jgi:hypothetical protein
VSQNRQSKSKYRQLDKSTKLRKEEEEEEAVVTNNVAACGCTPELFLNRWPYRPPP